MTATLHAAAGQMYRGSIPFPSTGDPRPTLDLAAQLHQVGGGLQRAVEQLRQTARSADAGWDGAASIAFLDHLERRISSIDTAAAAVTGSIDPVEELSRSIATTASFYSDAAEVEIRMRQAGAANASGGAPPDQRIEQAIARAINDQQLAASALQDAGEVAAARLRANTDQLRAATAAMTPLADRTEGPTAIDIATVPLTVWDHIVQGVLGDLVNFWSGKRDDSLPYGQLIAELGRTWKIATWVRLKQGIDLLPTFNNGMVGKALADFLWRFEATAIGGLWLSWPKKATPWFRGLGVAGGVVSTGIGVANLIEQGNPVEAFNRNPAGYVADVASTAFSASTTAFLIAPNPVTAGLAIVTGVVWAGAEIVDHWDEITEWTSDTATAVSETASALWDDGTEAIASASAALNRTMNDTWDSAVSFFSGSTPTLGAWF